MGFLFRFGNGITVNAGRLPLVSLLLAESPAVHRHPVCYHECRVETYTELTDNLIVFSGFMVLFKLVGSASGNNTQIAVQLLPGHADSSVPNGNRPGFFVRDDFYIVIFPSKLQRIILQRPVIHLVHGITGVGNQFPQEDFLVGVDGVNHQLHQSF